MRRLASNRGFSLPEVLVAVAVFGITAAGVSSILLLNMASNRISKETTAASSVAQSRIEQFRSSPTAPTASSDTVTIDGLNYNRTWTVATTDPTGAALPFGVYRVTVSVTWREPQPEAVQIVSYVTN